MFSEEINVKVETNQKPDEERSNNTRQDEWEIAVPRKESCANQQQARDQELDTAILEGVNGRFYNSALSSQNVTASMNEQRFRYEKL